MEINPIPEYLHKYYFPIVGSSMLELGNKKSGDVTYKQYFESQGIKHTSIDWNGLDGALKLDLRDPIDLGQFDMVTNIGTTEHVSTQRQVWENLHNAVKVGGVLVSHGPLEGDWWWHGEWYVKESFYEAFAKENGYVIKQMGIERDHPNRTLNVRMKKIKHNSFVMPDESTIFHNIQRPR
jgi:SAM-dependent methyltransferase